jgi:hypothetical protein
MNYFDNVIVEGGPSHYAEFYDESSFLKMPYNALVNIGYIILGIFWLRRIATRRFYYWPFFASFSVLVRKQQEVITWRCFGDCTVVSTSIGDQCFFCSPRTAWTTEETLISNTIASLLSKAVIYGPVQFMRIVTQERLWGILDQWITLPFFALVVAWNIALLWRPSVLVTVLIEVVSVASYLMATVHPLGFEIALG